MTVEYTQFNKLVSMDNTQAQKAFKDEITKVKRSLTSIKKQQESIHEIAIMAAYIFTLKDKNGKPANQLTPLNDLLQAFEDSGLRTQVKQFRQWASQYLNLQVKTNNKTKAVTFKMKKSDFVIDLEKCNANPYYNIKMHSKDDIDKMFGVDNVLRRLESLEKQIAEALKDPDKVTDLDKVVQMQTYIHTLVNKAKATGNDTETNDLKQVG